ncbi:MAG: SH3 domain-containing protein [Firmicutes bacterium]|nr:SH3 domain-containing protein [Bacillota bacterium]MBQ3111732.1 SH3 domain-containing protein [Bacillota bacterium]MBQ6842574.1 SH3 domain-containing protein [Bacillota bacterium]
MSKGGVTVLIVAAIVFLALGFVLGQVVEAAYEVPGSADDPLVSQSYVEALVGERLAGLQTEVDELRAQVEVLQGNTDVGGGDITGGNDNPPVTGGNDDDPTRVKVTGASVNIRATASTSANIVGSVVKDDVLTYLGTSNNWYNVKLSDGTTGWIRNDLCTAPY